MIRVMRMQRLGSLQGSWKLATLHLQAGIASIWRLPLCRFDFLLWCLLLLCWLFSMPLMLSCTILGERLQTAQLALYGLHTGLGIALASGDERS